MAGELNLDFIWQIRLSFYAEGGKLCAEGSKLRAEGNKLWAESDKLYAESDKLWAEAILRARGNIEMRWENWNKQYSSYECHLATGEVFGFEDI